MKILVIINNDGEFQAAHKSDRPAVLNLIENDYQGGSKIADAHEKGITNFKEDLSEYCCQEWDKIVDEFVIQGTLQYVEIPDTIPTACKCG